MSLLPQKRPVTVAVLGCTGSVGTQTLEICRAYPDRFKVIALSAYRSYEKLLDLAAEFQVPYLALADPQQKNNPEFLELFKSRKRFAQSASASDSASAASCSSGSAVASGSASASALFAAAPASASSPALKAPCKSDPRERRALLPQTELLFGREALVELASLPELDVVVNAVVGEAGIWPAWAALRHNKRLACANKEALVSGGDLLMPLAQKNQLIPVDSEHSAIFQCLQGSQKKDLERIWLTCSGGPFFGYSREELSRVRAQEALKHPNWSMGAKITIDSASLMNKGLEVIEAHHLFGVDVDKISVLIHRESRVHSLVEFTDGCQLAELGPVSMLEPIRYALSYPDRLLAHSKKLDLAEVGSLSFARPDLETFGCLKLAYEVGKEAGVLPCAMNAANEVANAAFRAGRCRLTDIEVLIRQTLEHTRQEKVESLEQLEAVDVKARRTTEQLLTKLFD